jgi:hypothetical protein
LNSPVLRQCIYSGYIKTLLSRALAVIEIITGIVLGFFLAHQTVFPDFSLLILLDSKQCLLK